MRRELVGSFAMLHFVAIFIYCAGRYNYLFYLLTSFMFSMFLNYHKNSSSAAQEPIGPPVTQAGVAPVSPWAVFVTWDQPNGTTTDELWGYILNFTHFTKFVKATDRLMFFSQDTDITPGTVQHVFIEAVYTTKGRSQPVLTSCRLPPACMSFLHLNRKITLFLRSSAYNTCGM